VECSAAQLLAGIIKRPAPRDEDAHSLIHYRQLRHRVTFGLWRQAQMSVSAAEPAVLGAKPVQRAGQGGEQRHRAFRLSTCASGEHHME
jgi:hypothetical protein